jgi:hypothetical protein
LEQKVCILIINIFNSELAETAVFFTLLTNVWIAQELNIVPARGLFGDNLFLFDD